MKTSHFRIEAIKKSFPFLFRWPATKPNWITGNGEPAVMAERSSPLVNDGKVYSLTIARVTKELLASTPRYTGATGSLVGIDDDFALFLLDEAGSVLGEVRQAMDIHHNEAHRDHEAEEGETVGEAIVRLGVYDVCTQVLGRHTGFIIRDHHSSGGYDAVLYLCPKGWTISGWCTEELRRAEAQVTAELNEFQVSEDAIRLAYVGAREDLELTKRQLFAAEARIRALESSINRAA